MSVDVFELLELHGVDLTHVHAWIPCYFPFTMGGDVWRAGGVKLPCERPTQIGEFFVCQINGPDGATAVCEITTGGVVGETLDQVRKDIEDAYGRDDLTMMRKQVDDAKAYRNRNGITKLTVEEFWDRLLRARRKAQ